MSESVPAQGADVHVPPPLVYAGTLAAAWAVDRLVRWRMPDSRWRSGVGWGLVAAGQALGAAGAATFRRHQTTVIPGRPATTMVSTGPYVYTRNPMYLGLSVAYAGGSLVLGTWWAVVALPGVVAYIDRNVIRREEAYLRERFGDEYQQFSAHTRRWV